MANEPTIQELLDAAKIAVQGDADKDSDWVRGSDYEALNGPTAVIFSRESRRDTDLFNSANFNTAKGADLTRLAYKRFGKERVLEAAGTGHITVRRVNPTTSGTFWEGTRVHVFGPTPKLYRLSADTAYSAGESYMTLAIESDSKGLGVAHNVGPGAARFDDIIEDSSWYVESLVCGDGTEFEEASAFRERIRRERLEDRVGQQPAIIRACMAAGAAQVALFRSDYAGDSYDYGLNFCYVGNAGYVGTPSLVKACFLALRSVRVAGDSLQVLPMQKVELDINASVYLAIPPSDIDLVKLSRVLTASVRNYLNEGSGRFGYTLGGIRTAITRSPGEVQRVVLNSPTAENLIVEGSMKNFPAVLNRYVPGNITFQFLKA